MSRLVRPPVAIGLMMGLMLPWTLHAEMSMGAGFLLAHLAVVGPVAALALMVPRLRPGLTRIAAHRPRLAHLPIMAVGLGPGWGAICLYCLIIAGEHH